MDPLTKEVKAFQEDLRDFLADDRLRVLWVPTDPGSLSTLQQTMRGEEWNPDNRSPFLLFSQPQTRGGGALWHMNEQLRTHYEMLRDGLTDEGEQLQEFGDIEQSSTTFGLLMRSIQRWVDLTADVLDPPLICWLPAAVEDPAEYAEFVRAMIEHAPDPGLRFVFGDDLDDLHLRPVFEALDTPGETRVFTLDQEAMTDWFKKTMLAPAPKGRAAGAPPGAAAPDVEPPPRPGPPPPSDEHIRAVLEEEGLPPVLTTRQGEELERLVFEAAGAVGGGDQSTAIAKQTAAFELCGRAGVKLEQGMMALVLAGYLVQFGRVQEAAEWYRSASDLALEAGAPAQASQALLGLGYAYFQGRDYHNAALVYREAADHARDAEVSLLTLEHLRMVGVSLHENQQPAQAIEAWAEALQVAADMKPGELAASGYEDMVGRLDATLRAHGSREQREWVEELKAEITSRREAAVAEQGTTSPMMAPNSAQQAERAMEASGAAAPSASAGPHPGEAPDEEGS